MTAADDHCASVGMNMVRVRTVRCSHVTRFPINLLFQALDSQGLPKGAPLNIHQGVDINACVYLLIGKGRRGKARRGGLQGRFVVSASHNR